MPISSIKILPNKLRKNITCIVCKNSINKKNYKFCSNKCQLIHQYNTFILGWKDGKNDGSRGIIVKNISQYIRRYLISKFGERCSICFWDKRNPITSHVPLEIDHINGNSDDNREENLRLLCPNCHALTPNFRNLNKGKGRSWRKQYIC